MTKTERTVSDERIAFIRSIMATKPSDLDWYKRTSDKLLTAIEERDEEINRLAIGLFELHHCYQYDMGMDDDLEEEIFELIEKHAALKHTKRLEQYRKSLAKAKADYEKALLCLNKK